MSSKKQHRQFLPWLKWWVDGTLYGSLASAPLDEVGFLVKVCCLAQRLGQDGSLQKAPGIPYNHIELASMLSMSPEIFEAHLSKQIAEQRISQNGEGMLSIENFNYYQRERGVPPKKKEGEGEGT